MKTYWPYIPMLALVFGGYVLNSYLAGRNSVLGYQSDYSQSTLLNLTNSARGQAGQSSLSLSSQLNQAAQLKASSIAAGNYWSHVAPNGETPTQLLSSTGYQFAADGENLAYGFSSAGNVMSAWLNSPAHRANVLGKTYTQVGFGVAESSNFMHQGPKVIVVAEYAEPLSTIDSSTVMTAASLPKSTSVSRIQVITRSNNYEVVATAFITFGLAYMVLKHGIMLRKLVQKGELYAVSHPMIDIALVAAIIFLIVFSQSAGFIG